jgi:1-acyl-sn-glycerol-3-phosphate acyltransferase
MSVLSAKKVGFMKVKFRHRMTAAIIRPLFYVFARLRYNFKLQPFDYRLAKGPYLIISNHASDLDAFFVAMCFKESIYFVANDHIFRLGFISRIISYLASPIPILKSKADIQSVRDIRSLIEQGGSIGIFPEGNRTYNGSTTFITDAFGKLAKHLKVPIVIYNIEGGYLTSPRWGDKDRKGQLFSRFKSIITPEDYDAMTPSELTELVKKELAQESPDSSHINTIRYKGKRIAEHLERILYLCPTCKSYCSIGTTGDKATCKVCGLTFRYTEQGYLTGERLDFTTVLAWDLWQRHYLAETGFSAKSDDSPLFSDGDEAMYSILRAKKTTMEDLGTLSLYKDRLQFSGKTKQKVFMFTDILDMVVYGKQNLQFTLHDGRTFVFKNKKPRSAIKYIYHYYYAKQIERGEVNGFFGI